MTIAWALFAPAVLLLFFPADRLLSSSVQLRSFEYFRRLEDSPHRRPWWWVPSLWIDPLRGFGGVYLLDRACGIEPDRWALLHSPAFWMMTALLLLAIVCQLLTRRGDGEALLAPMGFVAGMIAALAHWQVASIGLAVAVVGVFGFRDFNGFFVLGLPAVIGLAFALEPHPAWIVFVIGPLVLPVVLAFLMQRHLEIPAHNASNSFDADPYPPGQYR